MCYEMAVEQAFRERTSRAIEDGDTITAEDDARADAIVRSFGLEANC